METGHEDMYEIRRGSNKRGHIWRNERNCNLFLLVEIKYGTDSLRCINNRMKHRMEKCQKLCPNPFSFSSVCNLCRLRYFQNYKSVPITHVSLLKHKFYLTDIEEIRSKLTVNLQRVLTTKATLLRTDQRLLKSCYCC